MAPRIGKDGNEYSHRLRTGFFFSLGLAQLILDRLLDELPVPRWVKDEKLGEEAARFHFKDNKARNKALERCWRFIKSKPDFPNQEKAAAAVQSLRKTSKENYFRHIISFDRTDNCLVSAWGKRAPVATNNYNGWFLQKKSGEKRRMEADEAEESDASELAAVTDSDLNFPEQFRDPSYYDNDITDSLPGGDDEDADEEQDESSEDDEAELGTEHASSHSTHSAGTPAGQIPPPAQAQSPPAPEGLPKQGPPQTAAAGGSAHASVPKMARFIANDPIYAIIIHEEHDCHEFFKIAKKALLDVRGSPNGLQPAVIQDRSKEVGFLNLPNFTMNPSAISKEITGNQALDKLMRFASPELQTVFDALGWTDQMATSLLASEFSVADIQLQDTERWADTVRQEVGVKLADGDSKLAARKGVIEQKEGQLAEECNLLEAQMMRVREMANSIAYDRSEVALLMAEHQMVSNRADGRKRKAQQIVDDIRRRALTCGGQLPQNLVQLMRNGIRVEFQNVDGKRARFWKDVHGVPTEQQPAQGASPSAP